MIRKDFFQGSSKIQNLPFGPLPPKVEIAQVVCEPIHVSIDKVKIHDLDIAK